MKLVYSTEAKADLGEIGEWIGQDSNVRAETFIAELRHACEKIADMPRAFPLLPHRPESGLRRRPYKSYLIFYIITEDGVAIARVVHAARDYEKILFPDD